VRKARRAAARRGRRLRIMFADEARFGRINRPRPCWAPSKVRPEVAAQLIREYIYLYGAVSPKDGTCVYLIMPTSNTACFQVFLKVLSQKFARQDILLVLDGAPNHRCGDPDRGKYRQAAEPTTTAATSSHEQHWSLRDCKRSSFACPSNVAGWNWCWVQSQPILQVGRREANRSWQRK